MDEFQTVHTHFPHCKVLYTETIPLRLLNTTMFNALSCTVYTWICVIATVSVLVHLKILNFIPTTEQYNSIPQNLEPVEMKFTPKRYKELVKSEKNTKTYRLVNGIDELVCCICLEEFKKGCIIHSTSCNHRFHPKCLGRYLKKECLTPKCPMCRKDLRE